MYKTNTLLRPENKPLCTLVCTWTQTVAYDRVLAVCKGREFLSETRVCQSKAVVTKVFVNLLT